MKTAVFCQASLWTWFPLLLLGARRFATRLRPENSLEFSPVDADHSHANHRVLNQAIRILLDPEATWMAGGKKRAMVPGSGDRAARNYPSPKPPGIRSP